MKQDYDTEAKRLAKTIDIAIESFHKYPPKELQQVHLDHIVHQYTHMKERVLHPKPEFRKISSLKYAIQDVFTYFQEGNGETVEYFWKQLEKENLSYVREDKLRKIIDRKKIRGRIEYELVVDHLVVAEQDGRITKEEAILLAEMIGEYETKPRKK